MTVDFDKQIRRLEKKLRSVIPEQVRHATGSALSHVAGKMRTKTAAAVRKSTGLPAARIKERFRIKQYKKGEPYIRLDMLSKDIAAINAGVVQTRLKTKGGRIVGGGAIRVGNFTYKGAFVAPPGKRMRKMQILTRKGRERLPVRVERIRIYEPMRRWGLYYVFTIYRRDFKPRLIHELTRRIARYAK